MSTHDLANLRSALLAEPFHGAIPHEVRGAVWLLLLRLRAEALLSEDAAAFAQNARESVADANSREQIEKDVARTRPGLARFKQPAVRGALLRLLSLFCARRSVAYVQGFNELLAPFVLLADTGGNPRIVFALFSEFVTRFAPWMLETSESRVFDVLKRMFKYFGRLLLYHDPELYWLLERHTMTPDLYATSWFVTLFARNFTVESVLALWDLLLLEDDPLGTVFFGIALLCSKREELLSVDESRIPETLMLLTANSPDEVRRLWKIGSTMRAVYTPPSFRRLMTDRLLSAPGSQPNVALSAARSMQASVCLQTTPEDLVAGDAHYFTWDCRTELEYNAGHLAQAAHLPLDALRAANGRITNETSEAARAELQAAVDRCEPLRDSSHICLVGSGIREEDNMDINMVALYLTRIGVRYVSTLRGGFREALAAASSDDSPVELVDYDHKKFERARKARMAAQAKRKQGTPRNSPIARTGSPGERRISKNREESIVEGSSRSSASDQADSTPTGQAIASFLEKTDAEVSRALNKALNGMGFKYAISPISSGLSGDRENANEEQLEPSGSPANNMRGISPDSVVSPSSSLDGKKGEPHTVTKPSPALRRTEGGRSSQNLKKESKIRRSRSSMTGGAETWKEEASWSGRNSGAASVENSPRLLETPPLMSPKPGAQIDTRAEATEGPERQRDRNGSNGFFGAQRSPWGRDAKPGWLGDETLQFPLSAMPKGFTVNVMDDRVMTGLRLFPCKARSDRSVGLRGRSTEFKKKYVGVSANYLLLLSPHHNRNHLLEVKLIRYLQDISRITFKRSRPEVVTFEVLTSSGDEETAESIVCLMPDGLKECVALIKDYLASQGVGDDAEESKVGDADVAVNEDKLETRNGAQDVEDARVDGEVGVHRHPAALRQGNCADSGSTVQQHGASLPLPTADGRNQEPTRSTEEEGLARNVAGSVSICGYPSEGEAEADCMEFGEFQAAPSPLPGS